MPSNKKGKKPGTKASTTQKSKIPTRGTGKQVRDSPSATSPLLRVNRLNLRSDLTAETVRPFEDPESLLRKSRKSRKSEQSARRQDRVESSAHGQSDSTANHIQTPLAEEYQAIGYAALDECSDTETTTSLQGIDTEQNFYKKWGYLPPLDEESVAVIDAIIANPDMAKEQARVGPEHTLFPTGLAYRNVFVAESADPDPYAEDIRRLTPKETVHETEAERESHGQLWTSDQAKCKEGSNEALFQRTIMMGLIARHRLIYEADASNLRFLDFSVEELWTCPPMPTRAYTKETRFLTQPKPDLAICFYRQNLIPNKLWNIMPAAIKRLACFENISEVGGTRVFHFFTIEAKKSMTSSDDIVGKRQSLNNASQALHNMFEFFRDAGKEHEETFFTKVRFFSGVASTEGLTIRIHRATREPEDGSGEGFIMPDRPEYPLRFEYREFSRTQKDNFDRKLVIETFEKILQGYGVNVLRLLLQSAATVLMKKLEKDPKGMLLRESDGFYRYGQTEIARSSRKQTPAGSQTPAPTQTPAASQSQSEIHMSFDGPQRRTSTPTENRSRMAKGTFNHGGKRNRGQSEESEQAGTSRPRT